MTAKNRSAQSRPFVESTLPVIPLRDMVLFPGTVTPLLLGRPQSLEALAQALKLPGQTAFFTLQENSREEDPLPSDLKPVGVVGRILSTNALPNGLSKILVEGQLVATAQEWIPGEGFLSARGAVQKTPAEGNEKAAAKLTALVAALEADFAEYAGQRSDTPPAMMDLLGALPGPLDKVYAAAGQLKLPVALKQSLLELDDPVAKVGRVRAFLANEIAANTTAHRLEHEVRAGIAQSQKEYFLSEHLRKIQGELGAAAPSVNPEIRTLEGELRARGLPEKALARAISELRRLDYVHTSSPEYAVIRSYVDWFLDLPWNRFTEDKLDLARVKAILDRDQFGLKDVKDRILEHVAVFKLSPTRTAPILCLVGPPGTGKTSLGRSVALALGREFVRVSLGGLRDEAEIRGHRRTYIGSMPGRIVQALKKCQTMNPVILLDEIDKMGGDFRGDPASALLEVLDPEQNKEFTDHFLETGIDLSRVFFITTANVEERIPAPLHDRMEVIRLPGYHASEKRAIARKHLLPKIREAAGLSEKQLQASDTVLEAVIRRYTREAGVRQLHRELSKLARKRARELVTGRNASLSRPLPALTPANLQAYLGMPVRQDKTLPVKREPGIVTGLAWTPAGGETLRVECTLLSGRGKLTLTGNLGDVMKESAHIALTLARQRAQRFGIDPALFQKTDIHLHVPEGAISKDGPSAGIALVLALVSAMTRRAVDPRIAFTGEVSLSGNLHAIGGLPEKALAALQSGATRLCIPKENAPDARELPKEARTGLKIHLCDHIDECLTLVFGGKLGVKTLGSRAALPRAARSR
jgi:ATP-dependent Lon protease